jgi:glycosyltransferase involved in cell wall biosynthesis
MRDGWHWHTRHFRAKERRAGMTDPQGGRTKIAVVANAPESLVGFRGPLLRLLVARGHEVHTLAPGYSVAQRQELEGIGVYPATIRIERTGQSPLSDLSTLVDLRRWFRRARPDVSLTYFIKPNIYGGLAAALTRIPRRVAMVEGLGYLFTDNGDNSLKRSLARFVAVALLRAALRRAHQVIFLNPDDRDEFVARKIVRREQVLLLGGIGVDLDFFSPASLPDGPPSFLMIGRLLREKGVCEYIEAARLLKTRYPAARFRLVGGRDDNPGGLSAARVHELLADGAVEWLGELADIRPAIADCSVYVLPSYREGVPRSTQEAMAMGRPVVTTDVPGCRETVRPGINGFFATARDAASLAEAMARFCDDPGLIPVMGAQSLRIAQEQFDIDEVNERIYGALTAGNALRQTAR